MDTVFVVSDGFNTSYIDSLIVGLFYKETHLDEMLIQIPEKMKFAYLQELMYNNIVYLVRHNFCVDATLINEIRNYSIICGWKCGLNITELYNVIDYLDFLITGFNFGHISYEIIEIQKGISETTKSLDINYIQINVGSDNDIQTLLKKWICNILLEDVNDDNDIYYHFKELPMFITIYLNRTMENKQINTCSIDIKKRIKFYKNNDKTQSNASWIIHCIICYSNSSTGKYYTILNDIDNYYIFNNDKIPSMSKIDIKNKDIARKIKQECVLVIYRFDNSL
jgi:hypothetical protein